MKKAVNINLGLVCFKTRFLGNIIVRAPVACEHAEKGNNNMFIEIAQLDSCDLLPTLGFTYIAAVERSTLSVVTFHVLHCSHINKRINNY